MPTAVELNHILGCLRGIPQWVCWKYVERNGVSTKCPVDPQSGRNASVTDPATWTTFDVAVEAAYAFAGVGFVLTADDPFCGIDIDDCLNEAGDFVWGQDLVQWLGTYTEISPSGRGVKLLLRGRKPPSARCAKRGQGPDGTGAVEVFDRARFFTITGEQTPDSHADIMERQEELDALCRYFWPEQPTTEPAAASLRHDRRFELCLASMLRMNIADRNDGSFRLFSACCRCVEHDLSESETLEAIRAYEAIKPFPQSWSDREIARRFADAEHACQRGSALAVEDRVDVDGLLNQLCRRIEDKEPGPLTVRELVQRFPRMRHPIIQGLLRRGETMNVIAAAKTGKSWLASDLAIAVATAQPWLGYFETEPGRVLIVDNELHPETSASRIPRVAEARCISLEAYGDRVVVDNLRGRLRDLHQMVGYFDRFESGEFDMIILDAFYRFLPRDTDENDNGAMANLYNVLDCLAEKLKASFVLVHHASKGNQSGKAVTDVGAGAGSQSRATDTHLVLRQHAETGVVALDAAVRSFPPVEQICLRWQFPVWIPEPSLDPTDLLRDRSRRRRTETLPSQPKEPEWNPERFAETFVGSNPKTKSALLIAANDQGLSDYKAEKLIGKAVTLGLMHRWKRSGESLSFATVPQPEQDEDSKRDAVSSVLKTAPALSNRAIAKQCGVSHTYVNRVRAELDNGGNKVETSDS